MATERDALEIHRREGRVYELIDGTLVEKAMGYYESVLAGPILQWLNNYLDKKPLGVAAGEAGYLRMLPKKMRAPDVSFISWKRRRRDIGRGGGDLSAAESRWTAERPSGDGTAQQVEPGRGHVNTPNNCLNCRQAGTTRQEQRGGSSGVQPAGVRPT
jgi:hypothetical protein